VSLFLELKSVTKNMKEITRSADHVGLGTYLHPEQLCPSGLTLATPWKHGWNILEGEYPWVKEVLSRVSTLQNASILAPYRLGLIATSPTADNDLDEKGESSVATARLAASRLILAAAFSGYGYLSR
jgi:hypothetical protein